MNACCTSVECCLIQCKWCLLCLYYSWGQSASSGKSWCAKTLPLLPFSPGCPRGFGHHCWHNSTCVDCTGTQKNYFIRLTFLIKDASINIFPEKCVLDDLVELKAHRAALWDEIYLKAVSTPSSSATLHYWVTVPVCFRIIAWWYFHLLFCSGFEPSPQGTILPTPFSFCVPQ